MGALTPIGNTVEEYWKNLVAGKSGAAPIRQFDASAFPTKFACEVKGFDPMTYMDRKLAQRTDPFTHYALAATEMAISDSGLDIEKADRNRIGVVFGSGIGGLQVFTKQTRELIENGPRRINPFFIPMMISDIAAGRISMKHGLKGPNYAVTSACATSSHALADSFMLIQRGNADVMITGGSEAAICEMGIGGFNAMKALSTRNDEPEKASRPFDQKRDGFVMGEGGGVLVLEELGHAMDRGARIYAEVGGVGMTGDAHHITEPAPDGEGAQRSMMQAIEDAGLTTDDVDFINTHGTSTPVGDKNETAAIKKIFGDRAPSMAVNSTKSMIGHLLGAAGAVESIATVLSIVNNVVHPTINLDFPDPECDLDYIPHKARERKVDVAICNTFGFGGHNASVLFRRYVES